MDRMGKLSMDHLGQKRGGASVVCALFCVLPRPHCRWPGVQGILHVITSRFCVFVGTCLADIATKQRGDNLYDNALRQMASRSTIHELLAIGGGDPLPVVPSAPPPENTVVPSSTALSLVASHHKPCDLGTIA